MSAVTFRKAAKAIEAKNAAIKRMRENSKKKDSRLLAGGSVIAGTLLAAYLDIYKGEPGEPAQMLGMPMNAVLGAAAMGVSMFLPSSKGADTAGTALGFGGVGLFSAAVYRIAEQKLQEREIAKQQEAGGA